MATKTINVLAVPEPAHDGIGFVGAVPFAGAPSRYVGASVDEKATKEAGGKIRFAFSGDPVEVPFEAYYRNEVRAGSLKVADEASAKLCGVEWKEADGKASASAPEPTPFDPIVPASEPKEHY